MTESDESELRDAIRLIVAELKPRLMAHFPTVEPVILRDALFEALMDKSCQEDAARLFENTVLRVHARLAAERAGEPS